MRPRPFAESGTASPDGALDIAQPLAAELAAELAAAWECAGLFGTDHAAYLGRAARVQELARDLPAPLELAVHADGVSLTSASGNTVLTPATRYASLRSALIACGFGCLRIHPGCAGEDIAATIDAIGRVRRGEAPYADATDAVTRATNARVEPVRPRLSEIEADTGRRADVAGPGTPQHAGATLASLARHRTARPRAHEPGDPGRSHSPSTTVDSTLARLDHALAAPTGERAAELTDLGRTLRGLQDSERAVLFDTLARRDGLDAESLATLFAAAGVRSVAEGMIALERSDLKLSRSALMLLRRLSTLAAGSHSEQVRVHTAFTSLTMNAPGIADDAAVRRLLSRSTATEFRSDEYTAIIDRLSATLGMGEAEPEAAPIDGVGEDLTLRALDAVVSAVTEASTWTEGRADAIRSLTRRGGVLAQAGRAESVLALLACAARPSTDAEINDAWSDLRATAAEEGWLGTALARCADADLLRATLAGESSESAAALLVRACPHARTPSERAALLAAAPDLSADALADAVVTASRAHPQLIPQLDWLVERSCPRAAAALVDLALEVDDTASALAALGLAERVGVALEAAPLRRAVAWSDDSVRMAAHRHLARDVAGPGILASILVGHSALPALSLRECVQLAGLLDDTGTHNADEIVRGALARAAATGDHARSAAAWAELLRRRRPGTASRLALAAWAVSPWRLGVSREPAQGASTAHDAPPTERAA